jgi:hypothetical protein
MQLAIFTTDSIVLSDEIETAIEQQTGHQIVHVMPLPRTITAEIERDITRAKMDSDITALLLHCSCEHGVMAAKAMRAIGKHGDTPPLLILVDGGWSRKERKFVYTLDLIC